MSRPKRTPQQQAADAVHDACRALNAAITVAHKAGLKCTPSLKKTDPLLGRYYVVAQVNLELTHSDARDED